MAGAGLSRRRRRGRGAVGSGGCGGEFCRRWWAGIGPREWRDGTALAFAFGGFGGAGSA